MAPSGYAVKGLQFAPFSEAEIKKLSVRAITNPVSFDTLMHPTRGGLYDPALGPQERNETCTTCGLLGQHCPGHVGHIELPVRVFHPLFFNTMFQLLRGSCSYCHHLTVTRADIHLLITQLRLLDEGLLLSAETLGDCGKEMLLARMQQEAKEGGNDGSADKPDHLNYDEVLEEYYSTALARAKANGQCCANTAETNQFRETIISEFLSKASSTRRCQNCGGVNRRLMQQGNTTVIAQTLQKKIQDKMLAKFPHGYIPQSESVPKGDAGGKKQVSESEDTSGTDNDESDESDVSDDDEGNSSENEGEDTEQQQDFSNAHEPGKLELNLGRQVLTPELGFNHLRLVWQHENAILGRIFPSTPTKNTDSAAGGGHAFLFLKCVPVSPSRFRPSGALGEQIFENERSVQLQDILKTIQQMHTHVARSISDDGTDERASTVVDADLRYMQLWQQLQGCVNGVVDAALNAKAGQDITGGIKQVLEKKEGLFRKHMMGKRVNYACRSVISPDPMIETDEIGIPQVFGTKLTYPETVTEYRNYSDAIDDRCEYLHDAMGLGHKTKNDVQKGFIQSIHTDASSACPPRYNFQTLRRAVINGPDQHPGATHVMDEYGNLTVLGADKQKRIAIAKELLTPPAATGRKQVHRNKQVYRHIRNGDYVLVNRQPTLHKASIMAHRARILRGERTLRLHYANCKTYNADFDGDEMNVHLPQNEVARAEAAEIAHAHNQYISLGGSPLRGLIQDHVVSGSRMICRDAFFEKDEFQQLLYAAMGDRDGTIDYVPPAMLKPRLLWTGKQIISSILLNLTRGRTGLNLKGKTQTNNSWTAPTVGPHDIPNLPKNMFVGAQLEGEGTVLFRDGLMLIGILDKKQIGSSAKGLVHACQEVYGNGIAGALLAALGRLFTAMNKFHAHTFGIEDVLLNAEGENARNAVLAKARLCGFPETAKYTNAPPNVDAVTLKKNVETIFRDSKEMAGLDAVMMSANSEHQAAIVQATCPNRLLKPFPHNHLQAMVQTGAKGSTVNATQISCLLGQQALEGKRVPVMVSGKTLPVFPQFDPSARAGGMILDRFLTGLSPPEYYFHCMAGREGLVDTAVKTSRSGYLQRCLVKHMEDLQVGYDLTVRDADKSIVQFMYGEDGLDVSKTAQLDNFPFMQQNYMALLDKFGAANLEAVFPGEYGTKARKLMKKMSDGSKSGDPVLSKLRPDRYYGSVSEVFSAAVDAYVKSMPDVVTTSGRKVTPKKMKQLMLLKWFRSLADPGEPVGVLAAQAIGEPSTQMTLNTFHFAGRSDMNVTLGIPRLREILMTASVNIKTPIMKAPLVDATKAAALAGRLCRVTLADVLRRITVKEQLVRETSGVRDRVYEILFEFIPEDEYLEKFSITQAEVMAGCEHFFAYRFLMALIKSRKGRGGVGAVLAAANVGVNPEMEGGGGGDGEDPPAKSGTTRRAGNDSDAEDDEDDEDIGGDDMGTLASKSHANRTQVAAYDDNDEDGPDVSNITSDGHTTASAQRNVSTMGAPRSKNDRIKLVLSNDHHIRAYDFDDAEHWCRITLAFDSDNHRHSFVSFFEKHASLIEIRATKGINRCVYIKGDGHKGEADMLQIEGQNLQELWNHPDIINVNSVSTNDIHAILRTYGVEAARATIVRQVVEVFDVYGIKIDPRHMALVADTMTAQGGYRAMNRMGLRPNVSPLLKMSFESTFDFLRNACLHRESDPIDSSSAQLVVGCPTHGGTGAFSLRNTLIGLAN